jgi:hypothetical protein
MSDSELAFDLEAALARLSRAELDEMAAAGAEVADNMRLLAKAGANVVGQCLAHQGTFYELDHYPKGDVFDAEFHSQYYYHAHRKEAGEHGHFHTFLRAPGMPPGVQPVPCKGKITRPMGKDALTHFVAISMDAPGNPIGLFTTNRWVTDETFYAAGDAIAMLERFRIEHTWPCLAVNRWISAMVKLFRPQIEALLLARDRTVAAWAAAHPGRDVYEDRELEVTSALDIDITAQVAAVAAALTR